MLYLVVASPRRVPRGIRLSPVRAVGQVPLKLALCALRSPVVTALCILAFTPTWAPARVHTVREAETLSHVAAQYSVSVRDLRRWNSLDSDRILVGQKLTVRLDASWRVGPGQTLSGISARTGVTVANLRRWNNLAGDGIRVGQTLRLRAPADVVRTKNRQRLVVRPGDTLSELAASHGTTVDQLRQLNGLRGDGIRAGQTLQLSQGPETEPLTYKVRPGDNLSTIGARFDVGLNLLRRLNGIRSDRIHPGQVLRLRPAPEEEGTHVVQAGETLSEIAAQHRIELSELRRINGIESDLIRPGQALHLRETSTSVHVVQRGDALWEIARAYDMTVADLKKMNDLSGNRIYPGQELRLTAPKLARYVVTSGDNLSEIAQLHQMSVAELQSLNDLRGSLIHPGQSLKVRPLLGQAQRLTMAQIPWGSLFSNVDGLSVIEADNGPYYSQRPKAQRQLGPKYSEMHPRSPLKTYRQARKLWKAFARRVDGLGRLSDDLAGWHIVLDPGHGGIDPGAIVQTVDGKGRKLYVVEDEYVYDITMRAYVLLRLHGAQVDITLLSPNHLIRHTTPPAQTFVHQMNEVFNSHSYNRRDRPSDWPKGTPRGLAERVRIAETAFRGASKRRTIFLSIHADIDARAREGAVVLYYESRNQADRQSAAFAEALLPALGAGARTRGQSLAVLRNNPAHVKALVEVRNLAYVDHAWALRFEQLRHRDAEKIVRGILDYAKTSRLARR